MTYSVGRSWPDSSRAAYLRSEAFDKCEARFSTGKEFFDPGVCDLAIVIVRENGIRVMSPMLWTVSSKTVLMFAMDDFSPFVSNCHAPPTFTFRMKNRRDMTRFHLEGFLSVELHFLSTRSMRSG